MNKGVAIVGFLLSFLAGMGLMWGVDHHGSSITAEAFGGGEWSDAQAAVPVSSKDPVWGNRNAPATVVLFSDFECPFCSKVGPTLDKLKEKYGPEKLRIVWKHNPLPFHKKAPAAHAASEVVFRLGGSKAFWKFHDLAFANQKALTPENFEAWAVQSGVDKAKFQAELAKNDTQAKMDADMAAGKPAGVRGTPASVINGILLSGAQPVEKFSAAIDEQLAEAQKLVAAGTKADQVYVKLSQANKAKAPAQPEKSDRPAEDDKTVWKVPVGDSPIKGNPNALVTIVEFSDFECPFCSKVGPTLAQIFKDYGDKVRVVWKDQPLPFHARALPAAALAREARAQKGDKGFFEAHDLLFENQKALKDEDLFGYAAKLGLNVDKVKAAISSKKYDEAIKLDQEIAEDFQASGTPHFFVNGRRLSGAQPVEKFKAIIDEEIKKAEELLKKGVSAANIYAELTKDGKAPPPPEKKDVGPAPAGAPWKGNGNAKVVLQIFSDYECPYCKRVEPTLDQVAKEYGDRIKIVWRHKPLPFHKNAPLAHEAAHEAFKQKGNAGFWAFHEGIFKGADITRPSLEKLAEEQKLDMAAFKKALDTNVHAAFVKSEVEASDKVGVRGTPGFSVNGYFISGAQPYPKFKKIIELALKEAK